MGVLGLIMHQKCLVASLPQTIWLIHYKRHLRLNIMLHFCS